MLLHDLTRCAAFDQQERRRAALHTVQDQRTRIVHHQTTIAPVVNIVSEECAECLLQIDRAGLQLQRRERCGKSDDRRNAACLAQAFDVPEMIDIRRPVIFTKSDSTESSKQRHAAVIRPSVAIVATTKKSASRYVEGSYAQLDLGGWVRRCTLPSDEAS